MLKFDSSNAKTGERKTEGEREQRREGERTCLYVCKHTCMSMFLCLYMFVYMSNGSIVYVLKLRISCFVKMHRIAKIMLHQLIKHIELRYIY